MPLEPETSYAPAVDAGVRLVHIPTGTAVATVRVVDGWWAKGMGVIGMGELAAGSGIVMPGIASIHTCFVKFPLDVLFLDRSQMLMLAVRSVPPWTPLVACRGAWYTVELGAGTLGDDRYCVAGDRWRMEK